MLLCLCRCHRGQGNAPPDVNNPVAGIFACIWCSLMHSHAIHVLDFRLVPKKTWRPDGSGYTPTDDGN